MKIFLCGFSGAGKSTLLNRLKEEKSLKGFCFVDLDKFIEQEHAKGLELGDFIRNYGLEHFRGLEQKALKELTKENNLIVALGGGALNEATISFLESDWHGIFFDIDFETCWKRIQGDSNRPLVNLGKENLQSLYMERLKLYKRFKSLNSYESILEFIISHASNNS